MQRHGQMRTHGPEGRKAGQEGIVVVPAIQKHGQVRKMNKDGIVWDHGHGHGQKHSESCMDMDRVRVMGIITIIIVFNHTHTHGIPIAYPDADTDTDAGMMVMMKGIVAGIVVGRGGVVI